jgi:hypothetical protein
MSFLGRRVVRLPLILLAINLVVALLAGGVVYGYAAPQAERRDQLTNAVQSLNYERSTADDDLAYVGVNASAQQALLERGLTRPQDRLAAATLLDELRTRHRLNDIHYSFGPAREQPAGPGRLARIVVRTSEVEIDMSGVTDVDLLAFCRAVAATMPGDVKVTRLQLARLAEPDAGALAQLRAGRAVTLVEGRLEFQWRSLIELQPGQQAAGNG